MQFINKGFDTANVRSNFNFTRAIKFNRTTNMCSYSSGPKTVAMI